MYLCENFFGGMLFIKIHLHYVSFVVQTCLGFCYYIQEDDCKILASPDVYEGGNYSETLGLFAGVIV